MTQLLHLHRCEIPVPASHIVPVSELRREKNSPDGDDALVSGQGKNLYTNPTLIVASPFQDSLSTWLKVRRLTKLHFRFLQMHLISLIREMGCLPRAGSCLLRASLRAQTGLKWWFPETLKKCTCELDAVAWIQTPDRMNTKHSGLKWLEHHCMDLC